MSEPPLVRGGVPQGRRGFLFAVITSNIPPSLRAPISSLQRPFRHCERSAAISTICRHRLLRLSVPRNDSGGVRHFVPRGHRERYMRDFSSFEPLQTPPALRATSPCRRGLKAHCVPYS